MSSVLKKPESNSCETDCGCGPAEEAEPKIIDRKEVIGLARANAAKNKAFKKATRAEKRVMIAKDVLSALSRGKIIAQTGAYVEGVGDDDGNSELGDALAETDGDESLQKVLEKVAPCQVCAKGAIFLCTVAMRNKVTVAEFDAMQNGDSNDRKVSWAGEDLSKLLGGIFTPKQLALIENEFEEAQIDDGPEPVMCLEQRFGDDDAKKLRVIFSNIVRNGGTFKPVPVKLKIDQFGYDQFGRFQYSF